MTLEDSNCAWPTPVQHQHQYQQQQEQEHQQEHQRQHQQEQERQQENQHQQRQQQYHGGCAAVPDDHPDARAGVGEARAADGRASGAGQPTVVRRGTYHVWFAPVLQPS